MNAKLNVLEEMMDTVGAPRTKSSRVLPLAGQRRLRLRRRPTSVRRMIPAPAKRTWRMALTETREFFAERAITWALMAVGVAALGWLAYSGAQFLFAWGGLVAWVRTAMI